jgi:tripartite-type tricarboxylate transporter receptor subunit TctC
MPHHAPRITAIIALLTGLAAAENPAAAQKSVADFYHGKNFTIIIGIGNGGAYDLTARSFGRHIGRYIPGNPTVVVQNMPGANSVIAANYVYNVAPKDGTVIWGGSRSTALEPMLGNGAAKFDIHKLQWLGSAGGEVAVTVAWHTARAKTFEDLFKQELIVGAVDPGAENYLIPNALNNLLGTKYKIVTGYAAQDPIFLAMERGEVEGCGNSSWSNLPLVHPQWFAEKQVNILVQLGLAKNPDIPDVPLIMDYAKNEEQRQILTVLMGPKQFAYPYFMAPGIPADRAAAVEKAFLATMDDKEFKEEIRKIRGEFQPSSGADMHTFFEKIYALSPEVVEKTRALLTPSGK